MAAASPSSRISPSRIPANEFQRLLNPSFARGGISTHSIDTASRPARESVRLIVWAALLVSVLGGRALAQDSPEYFRKNCMNCHTIGGGPLQGPDLRNVTERQPDREWLVNFMLNPRDVIDSGDPYAQKIFEESRNVYMPKLLDMTRQRAEDLLDFIEEESKKEDSEFKGLQISDKPFTAADRRNGRAIFTGEKPLANGGTACIACHSMHDMPALGGGRLGPDLTKVYERIKGRTALSAWLFAPGTETMQPIFKEHPLKGEEIHELVAYFEASARHNESEPAAPRVALLLMGLIGATALVFLFDAIWRRRFHAVRRPLVEHQSH